MKRNSSRHLFCAVLLFAHAAIAQQIPELSGPFGNLIAPDLSETAETYSFGIAPAAAPRVVMAFTPAVAATNVADIIGATIAGRFGPSNRYNIDGRFLRIDPDGTETLNEFRFRGIAQLPTKATNTKIAVIGEFKSLEDIYDQYGLTASASYGATSRIHLLGNLGFAKRYFDSGGDANDVIFGVGTLFVASPNLNITIDYRFENDLSDDNYSVVLQIKKNLSVGVGKNDTFFASYTLLFGV